MNEIGNCQYLSSKAEVYSEVVTSRTVGAVQTWYPIL